MPADLRCSDVRFGNRNKGTIETQGLISQGEGKAVMDVSTVFAKPCQFTSFAGERVRRWITEGFGAWQHMAIVMADGLILGPPKRSIRLWLPRCRL